MIGVITGLNLLFSGISKVTELFSAGKKLKEEITGTPSQASDVAELKAELAELPPEQLENFIKQMQLKIDMYEAGTNRLKAQEDITPEIADKVDEETASAIAYQRRTTRPWAVRKMVYFMLFPFYLVILDVVQHLAKNWIFFSVDKIKPFESFIYVFGATGTGLMDKLGNLIGPMPKTMAGQMYIDTIPWAAGIIMSYMTLRQIGKASDKSKGDGIIGKVIKRAGFFGKLFR